MSYTTIADLFLASPEDDTLSIWPVAEAQLGAWMEARPPQHRAFLEASGFEGQAGRVALLPGVDGRLQGVAFGLGKLDDPLIAAALSERLPEGSWALAEAIPGQPMARVALAWALGCYRFDKYREGAKGSPRLVVPAAADRAAAIAQAEATALVRDLVNTPAGDMGPGALAGAVHAVAERFGADLSLITGDALLDEGFPMVHAVGRAAVEPPRLAWLTWGDPEHPRISLVGKGVCFDTGGLNLKPGQYMRNMKKDMGGAAHVLALASLIMGAKLPVRLQVVVPAVENAIGGGAFRPGDVLRSRKGLTVEIGNTDAEGRLILGDALTFADESSPDLLIDMATLTGAARVALGPELPPFYTEDAELAADLRRHAEVEADPLWHMPLWAPYQSMLDSPIADVCHIADGPKGGSITAALFLSRFVKPETRWLHLDVYAWNDRGRPGRPKGGEAQGVRALFALIAERYGAAG